MKIKRTFVKLLNFFENCFMKNHSCICCYQEISDDTKYMLCEKCKNDIEILNDKICLKCGDKLNKNENCINDCKKNNYVFERNYSNFYYTKSAAKIIKNLKYGKKKYLAKYIAEMMSENDQIFDNIDVILYVPSSKKRLRERGFNQSKVLAEEIAKIKNISISNGLIKTKETIHQAGGSQKDRMKNLKNSFAFDEKLVNEVAGKNVLIVDDVFTTGSTLNECSKVVKKLNPKRIKTLTFAKTKFNLNADIEKN